MLVRIVVGHVLRVAVAVAPVVVFAGLPGPVLAQDGAAGPAATVADFAWMEGTWQGPDAFVSMSELARADGSADTIRVEYRRRGG